MNEAPYRLESSFWPVLGEWEISIEGFPIRVRLICMCIPIIHLSKVICWK